MVLRRCTNLDIREGNQFMKTIIKELLYLFLILIVQMLVFMYFIKRGWTIEELVSDDAFIIFWRAYVVCRIFVHIIRIKYGKNMKDKKVQ